MTTPSKPAPSGTAPPGLPALSEVAARVREILAKEGYVVAAMALMQAVERETTSLSEAQAALRRFVDSKHCIWGGNAYYADCLEAERRPCMICEGRAALKGQP